MLELLILKVADGKPLTGAEREALRQGFGRLESAQSAAAATGQGGGSQSAKFSKVIVTGDVDLPAGRILVGPYARGKANVKIEAGGVQMRTYSTVTIDLQGDGDVFIGSDLSAPGSTYLSIFSTVQTYNGEAMGAGDMLVGDNSASKANMLWQKSTGTLNFRGGTTTQVQINTSGQLTAGSGSVILDQNGVSLTMLFTTQEKIKWVDGGGVTQIYTVGWANGNRNEYDISVTNSVHAGADFKVNLTDNSGSIAFEFGVNTGLKIAPAGSIFAACWVARNGADGSSSGFFAGATGDVQLYRSAANTWRTPDSLTVDSGLNVGTAAGAGAGEINTSASIYPGGTNTRILAYENGSVAAAGTWTVRALGTNTAAFLIVAEAEGGASNRRVMLAIYSAGVVTMISNPDAAWAITSTAGKLCLYLSAGNLVFENRLVGASAAQNIMILGR